jgi:putative flippase GtrA
MKSQMLRFAMSGAAGYIVDSVVLYTAMAFGMGFLRGRLVSFACAVIATFVLNRRYTFAAQLQSTPGLRPPLWLEFGRYLAAMALGGVLNLATYWLVLAVTPHFPALFALAVAAGSLAGMVANFASAKWWVFAHRPERGSPRFSLRAFKWRTVSCLILVQAVFWTSHLHVWALPGLYMDAVNPDYLAAQTLNPELPNPVWLQPTTGLPVLGSLYHGVQNYYVGLVVFALLGFNMLALRVAQGLFAGGILVMTQLVLQRASGSLSLALAGALGLAAELAFIASFRTQMYIVMAGAFWLLLAIYLALGRRASVSVPHAESPAVNTSSDGPVQAAALSWFLSGLCAGLAVYSYFVFLFFVPVFVALGWQHTRHWRAPLIWLLGFALGMQTYVLGYALAITALGGFGPAMEWLSSTSEGLGPMSSALSFTHRLVYAWEVAVMTLQDFGNELMIFRTAEPGRWTVWKVGLLQIAPLLLIVAGLFHGWRQRDRSGAAVLMGGMLANWHIALLPLSFIAVSLIFGDRLWAHHYSALVPLGYVILFLTIHQLQITLRLSLPKWAGVVLMAALLAGNVHQQRVFFDRLVATGGVETFSDAINRMAQDALDLPADIVHVFPEWGFGMPFAFLTGNRRSYEVYIDDATLQGLADARRTLRVYYWKPETGNSYRETLLAHGYQISDSGTYLQRDQGIAFYWMEASR